MDIFKFNNPTAATKMEQGEIINGLKSKMWIERYDIPGEFKLIADTKSGIREKLTIGSFISHVDTTEIMIVENHEINDDKGKESEITITGRSYDSFLEHRVSGLNYTFPSGGTNYWGYVAAPGAPWVQLRNYIKAFIDASILIDDNNAIPYVTILDDVTGSEYNTKYRPFIKKNLHEDVLDLLKASNLGIKIARPGPWAYGGTPAGNTEFIIHRGYDQTDTVIFSYDVGEIESADYLWSNKNNKTYALVVGKWKSIIVSSGENEYNRRMILVDATSIDGDFTTVPTGTDLTDVYDYMTQLGLDVLASHNDVIMTKVELVKSGLHAKYRQDYNVGDLIMVNGDYNASLAMQVVEYVEIEDENGLSGYPTLNVV